MAVDPAHAPAGHLAPEAAGAYLGDLFEEHGRMVYGVCRLMLRDRTEAEDAAQQSFLSAYRSLLNGHAPREPAPWLATIARNECRARIRGRMAEPLALVDDSHASPADLESVVGQRAEIAALCEALAELPVPQRDAIVLREFYGLSYEEVGAVVGVSASAVDGLLVRARRRLQAELRPTRLASGALVVPLALQSSLASAVPGFASGASASGLVAKLASLPIAAKLAGAAATVAVVTTVGSMGPSPPPGTLAGGGASSVRVASTGSPADVDSRGPNKTTAAVISREHDGEDAATARQKDRDEDETEEDDRESGDDRDDDEADEPDEADAPDEAEGTDEADEPELDD
jgi:RNA polymerase sigma-70 factor (ECF subfamily)